VLPVCINALQTGNTLISSSQQEVHGDPRAEMARIWAVVVGPKFAGWMSRAKCRNALPLQNEGDPIMRSSSEPTLHDLIADPLIRSVMKADQVDPGALEAMLRSLGDEIRRTLDGEPERHRVPSSSGRVPCGLGCGW